MNSGCGILPRALLAAALFLSIARAAEAQSIRTIAGGGTDDGRSATSVEIQEPHGLALDGNTLLVASHSDNTIRRVDLATGIITTLAGNGGAGFTGDGRAAVFAAISHPAHLALDAARNVYVADTGNGRVRRIDASTGIITTFAGGGYPADDLGDGLPATEAKLVAPYGIVIDRGFLYVSDGGYETHRIRRVDLATGIITTFAGIGPEGFSGDGGAATAAQLGGPRGLAVDAAGNVYVAEIGNARVRRVDLASGIITTVAGGGTVEGDGALATESLITYVSAVAFDPAGNLLVAEDGGIRRVDRQTQIMSTVAAGLYLPYGLAVDAAGVIYAPDFDRAVVERFTPGTTEGTIIAGGGSYKGDGFLATSALIRAPQGLAVAPDGALYIADQAQRVVRRVGSDGIITTFAGNGGAYTEPHEGLPALEAAIGFPDDVAVHPNGSIVAIADHLNNRVWKVENGVVSPLAGGGTPADGIGDGGPARAASVDPWGVAFDAAGNLYIADRSHHRVRKVAPDGTISTVAGSSPAESEGGYAGDGGPATQALLREPIKAVVAPDGALYVADYGNGVIRRVAGGTITTFAGHQNDGETLIDDVLATEASMDPARIAVDANGNLFIADSGFHRVRRVDAATGIISTVAGSSTWYLDPGYSGDNGSAKAAKLNIQYETSGVAVDARGNVFVSDTLNDRVRFIPACAAAGAPAPVAPANGETGVSSAPTLTWAKAAGAFRYDVYLSAGASPSTLVAADLDVTSVTLANLRAGTQYAWRVVAKGDSFCEPLSTASSEVRTFVTAEGCDEPELATTQPANGSSGLPSSLTLSWSATAGATYDLYFGTSSPPPILASTLTSSSYAVTGLVGATYVWKVVAHASCDPARTTATAESRFTVAAACGGAGAFAQTSPAAGAANVPVDAVFAWTASAGATSYDLYLGGGANPPLFRSGLTATSTLVTGLEPGAGYSWKVVANACSASGAQTTPVATFTTAAACPSPEATSFVVGPPGNIAAGTTYVLTWQQAKGLDPDGGYRIERSLDPAFGAGVEVQSTSATSASFVAGAAGTYYHRVQPVASCNPTLPGAYSALRPVTAVADAPNVVFSTLPRAVISDLGIPLEEQSTSIAIENLGAETVQVVVGRNELASPPFFTIVDPAGGDAFLTLPPRTPKVLDIRFSGPPSDVARSYQGIVFAAALGGGLRVTPYAFVNLKVGGAPGAAPQFVSNGRAVEFVAFPGWDGDDATRPPLEVEIRNPGTAPMELAAEIGPEIWLRPEPGWNATPIAPGATRKVQLFTQRVRAPNGSALPRYTWFTARTRDGASARILVQDDAVPRAAEGRLPLGPQEESRIVPQLVSATTAAGDPLVSIVRLSNGGNETVQVDLVATPDGADGFDGTSIRGRTVLVPANDVVVLNDPLRQIFGLPAGSAALEVRAANGRIGSIDVSASVARSAADQRSGYEVPVFGRAEGARAGRTLVVRGVRSDTETRTTLVLAETSGVEAVSARVELVDGEGSVRGATTVVVPRYGRREVSDVAAVLAANGALQAASVRVTAESGGGTVAAVALVLRRTDGQGAALAGVLDGASQGATKDGIAGAASVEVTSTLVSVISGPLAGAPPGQAYDTTLGLAAPVASDAVFSLAYHAPGLAVTPRANVTVSAGRVREIADVVRTGFNIPAATLGRIVVTGPAGSAVYGMLATRSGSGAPVITTSIPVITATMQNLTGGSPGFQKPLYLDGIDQSLEESSGNRWILLLDEIGGEGGGVLTVTLYEAGNRSRPIAERDVAIAANEEVRLDTLFGELGLERPERSKARTNMLLAVVAKSGRARVAATAVAIDKATGRARTIGLAPTGGPLAVSSTLLTPVNPGKGRKRLVERP